MAGLTEDKIRKLRWDATQRTKEGNALKFQWHDDSEVAGHHIRLYPPKANGQSSKVFYLQYGPDIARKVYKIGSWGDWTLEGARDKARKVRRDYYDNGIDPNQAKKQKLQQAKTSLTVSELLAKYFDEHVSLWSKKYLQSNTTYRRYLENDLGKRLAEEVTDDDIKTLFLKIKGRAPQSAKQFRGFGDKMYRWAMDAKLSNPDMSNPFRMRSLFKIRSNPRLRVLESKKGEATQLFDMLKDYEPIWTHTVKLYLLTGFRNQELRLARWEHIDIEQRTFRNVKPKFGEDYAYTAYLCDTAMDCLKSLGLGEIAKGPIFPAERNTDEPRSDWNYWGDTISKDGRMPVSDDFPEGKRHIWLHDLRRTGVTWLQEMRFSVEDRTIFKGSKPSGVTSATYSQADQYHIRKSCQEMIEERIHDIEAGKEKTMFDGYRNRIHTTGTGLSS